MANVAAFCSTQGSDTSTFIELFHRPSATFLGAEFKRRSSTHRRRHGVERRETARENCTAITASFKVPNGPINLRGVDV